MQKSNGQWLYGGEQTRCAPFSEDWQRLMLIINDGGLHLSYYYHGRFKGVDNFRHMY